jgi:hypothetical protein
MICYLPLRGIERGGPKLVTADAQQSLRERDRFQTALNNPKRRNLFDKAGNQIDPLRPELECTLGRLYLTGEISKQQYEAGVRWRDLSLRYLAAIGAPYPFPQSVGWDTVCTTGQEFADILSPDTWENLESTEKAYKRGVNTLKARGRRVFHAVQSVVVYEEPEELGDFEFTLSALKIGLSEIAAKI